MKKILENDDFIYTCVVITAMIIYTILYYYGLIPYEFWTIFCAFEAIYLTWHLLIKKLIK
jgi:hypothetical protein